MLKLFVRLLVISFFLPLVGFSAAAGPHIVIDLNTGRVLNADRATDPWHPASITKLMTLYLAAKAVKEGRLSLQSTLTVSKNAASVPPSKMGFKPGTKVTLDNALKMLIIKSANDMAVAIGELVSGTEAAFIADMNKAARELGMNGTNFVNPHGLPNKGQIVTARDMALLGIALHKEFPELKPLYEAPAIRHGKRVLRSHNLLLEHYRGATGMKTGFTCSSGLTMVAAAKRGSKNYLAVVLGEASSIDRAEKAALLLEYAFEGRFKEGQKLPSFRPPATRSTPVDMRPIACHRASKIRKFQIVVPQPRPKKKKLFGRDKYVSPQRKNFARNLGDKSHPQGALVTSPGGRKYRSHILQPRIQREIISVYAGAYKGPRPTDLVINGAKGNTLLAEGQQTESVIASLPFPTPNPLHINPTEATKPLQTANTTLSATQPVATASASAFLSEPAAVRANTPSLHQQALVRERGDVTAADSLPQADGPPLSLEPQQQLSQNGFLLPRANPLR